MKRQKLDEKETVANKEEEEEREREREREKEPTNHHRETRPLASNGGRSSLTVARRNGDSFCFVFFLTFLTFFQRRYFIIRSQLRPTENKEEEEEEEETQ